MLAAATAEATAEYIEALRVEAAAAAEIKVRSIWPMDDDSVAWMVEVVAAIAVVAAEAASSIASCWEDVCACILCT